MKKFTSVFVAVLAVAFAAGAGATPLTGSRVLPIRRAPASGRTKNAVIQATQAFGVGINLDVVGRLVGSGNTLFKTSVDIANNTNTTTQVDAYFVGLIGGQHVELDPVSITASGIVEQGAGTLSARTVFHSDDFIDALRAFGAISQADENGGILGSLLVVYNSPSNDLFFSDTGQGAVQARFYSTVGAGNGSLSGGTIGVSANGHELTGDEPTSLFGIARDTIGIAGTPQVYTNFFINNEGFPNAQGQPVVNPIQIRLTGYSPTTHAITGQSGLISIGDYETVAVGNVFQLVGGNLATDDTLVVFVDIVSGSSAISGLSSTNDNTTKDPSAAQLPRADWAHGR